MVSYVLRFIAGEIYWTDTAEDVIQKATRDGKHIENIIEEGLQTADGIVVDSTGRKVSQKLHLYVLIHLTLFVVKIMDYPILYFLNTNIYIYMYTHTESHPDIMPLCVHPSGSESKYCTTASFCSQTSTATGAEKGWHYKGVCYIGV